MKPEDLYQVAFGSSTWPWFSYKFKFKAGDPVWPKSRSGARNRLPRIAYRIHDAFYISSNWRRGEPVLNPSPGSHVEGDKLITATYHVEQCDGRSPISTIGLYDAYNFDLHWTFDLNGVEHVVRILDGV